VRLQYTAGTLLASSRTGTGRSGAGSPGNTAGKTAAAVERCGSF